MLLLFFVRRYALKVGVTFLPVVCVTISFGLLAVNEDLLVFHYLFAVLCCCQSLFVLLFYVAFDQKVKFMTWISILPVKNLSFPTSRK